jgi:hypothetical protein
VLQPHSLVDDDDCYLLPCCSCLTFSRQSVRSGGQPLCMPPTSLMALSDGSHMWPTWRTGRSSRVSEGVNTPQCSQPHTGSAQLVSLAHARPHSWLLYTWPAGGRVHDIPQVSAVLDHSHQANGRSGHPRKLLHVVEEWLQKESEARHARMAAAAASGQQQQQPLKPQVTSSPYMPSKHLAFFR